MINLKKNTFTSSFIKILKPSVQNFYFKSISELNLKQALLKYKPDAVFNFYNVPMSLSSRLKSKYKMYGYFTIPPHITENVRRLNINEINLKNLIHLFILNYTQFQLKEFMIRCVKVIEFIFYLPQTNIAFINNIPIIQNHTTIYLLMILKNLNQLKKKNYFIF